ncbi:DNA repair protein RadC [Robiginitalea myxolifaciens]|uniref:DNA repair protein RadC n=1 Tax=Robiginitalea myxolifaciens TaxID=400055 RepID=A0A1I6HID7_9FLAO|nr:DNA repair protein RadC [Robiginitalea myxolifaciens]
MDLLLIVEKETYRIRERATRDRPRERLLRLGPAVLTDVELLAILLGSGTSGESSLDLAGRIIQGGRISFKGLRELSLERLQQFKGIGPAKAVILSAALEIGRRLQEDPGGKQVRIRQSRDAFLLLKSRIGHLEHEEFWVICLNSANKVLCTHQLSKGGITGTLVDVRLILKKALELQAVALVLAHNHPSGNLKPSRADQQITRKVKRAANLMDIRVLDHLILNGEEYYSFADEQLL